MRTHAFCEFVTRDEEQHPSRAPGRLTNLPRLLDNNELATSIMEQPRSHAVYIRSRYDGVVKILLDDKTSRHNRSDKQNLSFSQKSRPHILCLTFFPLPLFTNTEHNVRLELLRTHFDGYDGEEEACHRVGQTRCPVSHEEPPIPTLPSTTIPYPSRLFFFFGLLT